MDADPTPEGPMASGTGALSTRGRGWTGPWINDPRRPVAALAAAPGLINGTRPGPAGASGGGFPFFPQHER